jgi:hypothetical protein
LELPKSVAHASETAKRTGTDIWKKAIEKEICNVFPAFEFFKSDDAKVSGKRISARVGTIAGIGK